MAFRRGFSLCRQAADIVGGVVFGLACHSSLPLHPYNRPQISPTFIVTDVFEGQGITDSPASPNFDPSIPFMDGFGIAVLHVSELHMVRIHKPVLDVLGQVTLIVFDPQYVVGLFIASRLGDRGLSAHRIDRDNTACHIQLAQQRRNRRDFIRFRVRLPLPQGMPLCVAHALTRWMVSLPMLRLWLRRTVLPSIAMT